MPNAASDNAPTQDADVIVVGSGAGGAITAALLAEAGYRVIVMEEGPSIDSSTLSTHSPQALQRLYRNGGLSPILGKPSIAFVQGRVLGGSTEVNSAFWHRTPPEAINEWRERFAVRDLSADGMYALFDEIETVMQVTRLSDLSAAPRSSQLMKQGADRMGWAIEEVPRVQSTPLSRSAYAPGAKNSMQRTYLPRALAAGACLLSDYAVERVVWNGDRATGVLATHQGKRTLFTAKALFMCAGATQTPLVLRKSRIRRNVGDQLMIHPMLKVGATFDEQIDSHLSSLPFFQVSEFRPDITLGGSVFSRGYLALLLAEDWQRNAAAVQDWQHMALYYAACKGTGQGSVRVMPVTGEALLRYKLSPKDDALLRRGALYLADLLFAAGAKRLYFSLRPPFPSVVETLDQAQAIMDTNIPTRYMSLSTVHAFSSCPMGEAQQCAVDSYGKVHGFSNLYVSDASIIPDSPGVNPQGTVMALAMRNVRQFIAAPPRSLQ